MTPRSKAAKATKAAKTAKAATVAARARPIRVLIAKPGLDRKSVV